MRDIVALLALSALSACHAKSRASPPHAEPIPTVVDPAATAEAKDLAAQLDALSHSHVMVVGQQLPLWDEHTANYWRQPLDDLGATRVHRLVGFAADEYAGRTPDDRAAIMQQLTAWAKTEGKIIHVSFYPHNPASPHHDKVEWSTRAGTAWDRTSKVDLQALVDKPTSVEGQRFWRYVDTTEKPALVELARRKEPVVFRPLLEGNGDWFWWGCGGLRPAETVSCARGYSAVYLEIQRRVTVHNVLWEYSFAPWSEDGSETNNADGLAMRPRQANGSNAYDIAGISTYDEKPDAVSELPLLGLASLAKLAAVSSRVVLDEVGPQNLKSRHWDPSTVITTLRQWNATAKTPLFPLWARFWSDDEWEDVKTHENPSFKQLSSSRARIASAPV